MTDEEFKRAAGTHEVNDFDEALARLAALAAKAPGAEFTDSVLQELQQGKAELMRDPQAMKALGWGWVYAHGRVRAELQGWPNRAGVRSLREAIEHEAKTFMAAEKKRRKAEEEDRKREERERARAEREQAKGRLEELVEQVEERLGRPLICKAPGDRTFMIATERGYVDSDGLLLFNEVRANHPELVETVRVLAGEKENAAPVLKTFCRRVDERIYSYLDDGTEWVPKDANGGVVTIACGALRQAEPVYDERVDRWLGLVAGDQQAKVKDWIASSSRLDRPTAILFVVGRDSIGKQMLMSALAWPFGGHAVSYDNIAGSNFNSALLNCPFVHVDERVNVHGKHHSGKLRSLISEDRHTLTAKFKAPSTLLGCPRVVVTANNADALQIRESLNKADHRAIGRRILVATASPLAADYLESLGGRDGTHDWLHDGEEAGRVPKHFAWLAANRTVTPGSRFLVEGDPDAWMASMHTRQGPEWEVLLMVVHALMQPASPPGRDPDVPYGVFVNKDAVWVNANDLTNAQQFLGRPAGKAFTATTIIGALKTLTVVKDSLARGKGKWRRKCWPIEHEVVREAATEAGIDPDLIISPMRRSA